MVGRMDASDQPGAALAAGHALARGVCRHLLGHDFMPLTEFVPAPGLRVDVIALGPRGEVWVVECKSCPADFRADRKWTGYLPWCDRFFWAVDAAFPQALLPEGTGVILADAFDAEIVRMAPEARLAPARRSALLRSFARTAARQVQGLRDPGFRSGFRVAGPG
jgi:hypothetical protein